MSYLRVIRKLAFSITIKYLGIFLLIGFIYTISPPNPFWWGILGYPISFLLMWFVVFLAIENGIKKLPPETFSMIEKRIGILSISVSFITIILWLITGFLSRIILVLTISPGWISAIDLTGSTFLLPTSFQQVAMRDYVGLKEFLIQFLGAFVFLAALIGYQLNKKTEIRSKFNYITVLVLLLVGVFAMIVAQGIYLYHYFTVFAKPAFEKTEYSQSTLPEVKLNTEDWSQYHNEIFGITISYPENWTYKESIASDLSEFKVYFYSEDRTDGFSEETPHITLWGKEGVRVKSIPVTSEQPNQYTDLNGNGWIFRDRHSFKHPGFRENFAIVDLTHSSDPNKIVRRSYDSSIGYTEYSNVGGDTFYGIEIYITILKLEIIKERGRAAFCRDGFLPPQATKNVRTIFNIVHL